MNCPSAPNLHQPMPISKTQKAQNDTFVSSVKLQNYFLDQSSSIFSYSQDQSNQSSNIYNNLKQISSSIKQSVQGSNKQNNQSKKFKESVISIQSPQQDNSKDFIKQSSLLSQLQELNSSVEEENSNSHHYIQKLGGSLIYDPTIESEKSFENKLLINESQSLINFDPNEQKMSPQKQQKSYQDLIREIEDLMCQNNKLKHKLGEQLETSKQNKLLLNSLLLQEEQRKQREITQNDIKQNIQMLNQKLTQQDQYLKNQGLENSQISFCTMDMSLLPYSQKSLNKDIYNCNCKDKYQIERKQFISKQNELISQIQELKDEMEKILSNNNASVAQTNNVFSDITSNKCEDQMFVEYLNNLTTNPGQPQFIVNNQEQCLYQIVKIDCKDQDITQVIQQINSQQKQTPPTITPRSQVIDSNEKTQISNIIEQFQQPIFSPTNINLRQYQACEDRWSDQHKSENEFEGCGKVLRRTKTLANINMNMIKGCNLYDERVRSQVPDKPALLMTIYEELDEERKVEYSTTASTEGIQSGR